MFPVSGLGFGVVQGVGVRVVWGSGCIGIRYQNVELSFRAFSKPHFCQRTCS